MNGLSENAFSDKPIEVKESDKKPQDVMFEQKVKLNDVFLKPKQIEEVRLREGLAMAGG
jgi:hypothetical protein